ncbi:MAG: hypothetical protein IJZ19_01760 [Lentisphaeria bacterium]|nr:hypothetical protein [Lentisphaeria bacterium]
MLKKIIFSILAFAALGLNAARVQVFSHNTPHTRLVCSNGAKATGKKSHLKTPDGRPVYEINIQQNGTGGSIMFLCYAPGKFFRKTGKYEVSFYCHATGEGSPRMAVGLGVSPYTEFAARNIQLKKRWSKVVFTFDLNTLPGDKICTMPRIMLGGLDPQKIFIGEISVRDLPPEVSFKKTSPEWILKKSGPFTPARKPNGGELVRLQDGVFDVGNTVEDIREGQRFYFYNEFESDVAGVMSVGAAADWWFEFYANGKLIYSTLKTGNQSQNFTPSAHRFRVPVKKGKNLFAVNVIAGSAGAKFACGQAVDVSKVVIGPNKEYRAVDYPLLVEPGSLLDFSTLPLRDAPAGKYGRVITNDKGHFVFEKAPDKRLKLYGTNLVFDLNAPPREYADKLVRILKSQGFNSVRFHHYDYVLTRGTGDSGRGKLNPKEMEKFDYLFSELKKNGFYMTLDLHTLRTKATGLKGNVQEKDTPSGHFFRIYVKNLMEHVNPYTGLAYKDDPALMMICPVNENVPWFFYGMGGALSSHIQTRLNKNPEYKQMDSKAKKLLVEKETVAAAMEYREWIWKYLKGIGVKALLTDQNVWSAPGMALLRKDLEYVDNHYYWDHPGKLPGQGYTTISNNSAVKTYIGSDSAFYLPGPLAARIVGKPYTITEFNYAHPNEYRAEGVPLSGGYAALQDWDGMYEFDFGTLENISGAPTSFGFDNICDPIQVLSSRLASLIFLRGDVSPSEKSVTLVVPENYLDSTSSARTKGLGSGGLYPREMASLGYVCKIGTTVRPAAKKLNANELNVTQEVPLQTVMKKVGLNNKLLSIRNKFARSTTGELELNGKKGYFKVSTPKTAAIVLTGSGTAQTDALWIKNSKHPVTISFSALDDKNLKDSERILGLHLTHVIASGTVFSDKSCSVIERKGKLPLLLRHGIANVRLKLSPGKAPKVYAVALDGKRIAEVESQFNEKGELSFLMDNFRYKTPALVYEIIR